MAMEELSDDLLAEILHRLPLHFLLQCKSVSKQRFLRVISDPRFFHPRLTRHQLSPGAFETHTQFLLFHFDFNSNFEKVMLFSIDSNKTPHILKGSDFFPPSWPQDHARVRVRAAHYDLLLCSSTTQNNCYTHYFVCNPFTKQYVALPPIRRSLTLARVGFICDQSLSRFRVVHIPIDCFRYVSTFRVNMFSSEIGKWSASTVTIPHDDEVLLSQSCSKNMLVCDGKFVWVMKKHGLFVCDPFNGWNFEWRIIPMHRGCGWLPLAHTEWDVCHGICNGRVKTCVFSRRDSESRVFELVNFEEETWSTSVYRFDMRGVSINDIELLAFHPNCEHMIYFYSNKGVFLCDYKNKKLECLYTAAADEDMCVPGSVMSLVLPGWPTPVPTLNAAKLQE